MRLSETIRLPENQRDILLNVFRAGKTTRTALAESLSLTPITISKAVSALIKDGYIITDGSLSSAVGRRKDVLKLNPIKKLCACIDIGFGSIRIALVRLDGTIERITKIYSGVDPVKIGIPHDDMIVALKSLLDSVARERILGIAIGISGMVDYDTGRVLFCPNIKGYDDRPLALEIQELFGLPVLLDTSARCMALGEYYFGVSRGVKNQLYLSLGMGSIASGILANGRLYRGGNGFAGEIGHTCVRPGLKDRRCSCGGYNCLELFATLSTVCKNMSNSLAEFDGYSPAKRLLGGSVVLPELLKEVYTLGDSIVNEELEISLSDISSVVTGAVNLLAPELVVLGGGFVWQLPEIAVEIEKRALSACLIPLRNKIEFVISELGENVALMGAASMLILSYFGVDNV